MKINLKDAYRLVPVHLDSLHRALPSGLHSAPCSPHSAALALAITSSISAQVHVPISSGEKFFWNGHSFFPHTSPSVTVTSDASGSFGCGAVSQEHWFQLKWPANWNTTHIAAKELAPIVIAASLWGPSWHSSCSCFRTDNMAIVEVLRSHTSWDPLLMYLLRCLVFYAAVHHFDFVVERMPYLKNNLALFLPQVHQVLILQPIDGGQTQVGISRMDSLVQELLDQGISKSTQLVYQILP